MHLAAPLSIVAAYLIGAIPFGLLLSRSSSVDIRAHGSGNIGATNVARLLGKKLGFCTLLLDIGKGYLPMALAALLIRGPNQGLIVAICGLGAVLGHMYPVYLGFKGGKGVATGLGVFLYLAPMAVVYGLGVFLAAVLLSGFVSLGSLLASAAIPLAIFLQGAPNGTIVIAVTIGLLIWWKHRPNIGRLLSGTEKSWKKGKQ